MQKIFAGESLNIVGYYSDVGASTFDDVDIGKTLGSVRVDELHLSSRQYFYSLLHS